MLQINVHEREEKEQKNDSINNPRPRVALDCEFESKRNRPAFGEKKARSDLAAEKYVTRYLTSVLSQTFY